MYLLIHTLTSTAEQNISVRIMHFLCMILIELIFVDKEARTVLCIQCIHAVDMNCYDIQSFRKCIRVKMLIYFLKRNDTARSFQFICID